MKQHQTIYFLLLLLSVLQAGAQKPTLDTVAFKNWARLESEAISSDGQYIFYYRRMTSTGELSLEVYSIIRGVTTTIERPESGARFTPNSKELVYLKSGKLYLLTLPSGETQIMDSANAFRVNTDWLSWTKKNGDLTIYHLITRKRAQYHNVLEYSINTNATAIVLRQTGGLQWININQQDLGAPVSIFSTSVAPGLFFNSKGDRVSFSTTQNSGVNVYCYQQLSNKAELMADKSILGKDSAAWAVKGCGGFSPDGDWVLINLEEKKRNEVPKLGYVKVDVWSYFDLKLNSQQLLEVGKLKKAQSAVRVSDKKTVPFLGELDISTYQSKTYSLILHKMADADDIERRWNSYAQKTNWIFDWSTGEKRPFPDSLKSAVTISPEGTYLIFYDYSRQNYYKYTLPAGKITPLTERIAAKWRLPNDNIDSLFSIHPAANIRWVNEQTILVSSRGDIYRIDANGSMPPINLTGGSGKAFQFYFMSDSRLDLKGSRLIINAYDPATKDNGFYSIDITGQTGPQQLSMGPYVFNLRFQGSGGADPKKAQNTDGYIVRRQSTNEFPNYYFSTDLKTFQQVSSETPEKKYNWLTSELINWTGPDGRGRQGVLYKPQNFDPTKKYPLIVYIYEKLSQELNYYHPPTLFNGAIDIPFVVSNGYLVFTPDIDYVPGYTGRSALVAVESGIRNLLSRSYIDKKRLGLQGHSFGGFETNYIVTHSHLFAAACAAAAASDAISGYGSLWGDGVSAQGKYENGQYRIGATLWERQDLYLENSPVLVADKLTTPLLLMHNKNDDAVPFAQSIEMFTGLRRLGKRAWLLQYDGEAHTLKDEKNKLDYTIRVMQFFDHYLKSASAPKWMTRGVPAKMKGIDSGLDFDHEIITPGPGLLITPVEKTKKKTTTKSK